MTQTIYAEAAGALGWFWSSAHNGYIHENHRRNRGAPSWSDYVVAANAEEACFLDGVETDAEALSVALESRSRQGASSE